MTGRTTSRSKSPGGWRDGSQRVVDAVSGGYLGPRGCAPGHSRNDGAGCGLRRGPGREILFGLGRVARQLGGRSHLEAASRQNGTRAAVPRVEESSYPIIRMDRILTEALTYALTGSR